VGFEPKTPVFEGAKTVHDLNRAASVIGPFHRTPRRYIPDDAIIHDKRCEDLYTEFVVIKRTIRQVLYR
jgi:hypothetical protein